MCSVMDRQGPYPGAGPLITAMLVLEKCHSRSTGPVFGVILIPVIPVPPTGVQMYATTSEVRVPSVCWHIKDNSAVGFMTHLPYLDTSNIILL